MGEERRRSWAWKTETRQLLASPAGLNRAIRSWLSPFKPEVSELCGRVCGYPHPGGEYGGGLVNSPLRRSWSPSFCLGETRHPFGEQVPWWSGQAAPGDDQLKKKVSAMQSVFFSSVTMEKQTVTARAFFQAGHSLSRKSRTTPMPLFLPLKRR